MEISLYILGGIVGCLVLIFVFRLWETDLSIPLQYTVGGDTDFFLALFKNTIDTGWFTVGPRLGAPGTMDLHDFPDLMTGTFLLVRFVNLFSSDLGYVFNGFYGITFILAICSALFVMRQFHVCPPIAIPLSLLFAFCPFHFYQGMSHPHYSAFYPIPLVVLLCLWILGEDRLFLSRRPGTWPNWCWSGARAWVAVVSILLIGFAGPYYVAFSLFLLLGAGLISVLRHPSEWEHGLDALILVSSIVCVFSAQMVPYWTFRLKEGPNPGAVVRKVSDYYSFGLSINNLLMPSAWHRIEALRPLSLGYDPSPALGANTAFHLQNEAVGSNPLGLVASLGLISLIALGVAVPKAPARVIPHIASLASLSLLTLLIGLSGGLSEVIALHVTELLRSYNRIAIFLSFMGMLAVGFWANAFWDRWATTWRQKTIFIIVAAVLATLALWEQIPAAVVSDYQRDATVFQADRDFMTSVEKLSDPQARIFQLPYVEFPEGDTYGISGYDHMRGFYHSKSLRWSFGAIKGRSVARWQKSIVRQPVPELIAAIRQAGFTGLYVNRLGYQDRGEKVLREIVSVLGPASLVSSQKDLLFFSLAASPHAP